ncbi:MAG TPA: hypothetical protein VGX78_20870 [Pirellulales bacterium]|jgi:hypothetical protein|nr:hypothetical protein [Pirellulales bacterium]
MPAATCPNCHAPLDTARPAFGRLQVCRACGKPVPVAVSTTRTEAPRRSRAAPRRATLDEARTPRTLWFVRSADGVETGPISKLALDEMARDGRLADTSRIRQQDWSESVPATDLYPRPNVDLPGPGEGSPFAAAPQDVPSNPLLPPTAEASAAPPRTTQRGTDPALVVAAFIVFTVFGLGWLALRRPWQETPPAQVAVYFCCYALGVSFVCAAVLNWRFFWWFRKTRFMRTFVSEKAARWAYVIGGGALTLFALGRLW